MGCRAQEQPGTSAGTVAQVVQGSEVLILTVPGQFEDAGIQEIAASLGDVKGEPDTCDTVSRSPPLGMRGHWKCPDGSAPGQM